ncbi:metal-sulfur cluster assembly factor [Candidatus Micrarchaeota archaeon]|nr:metal-sulfur cluster assembly factor [Candidatus Micrarchaeota archaeon]MBU1930660.1 metal-sulfur cluster assembly factor [Candidatus Micrarchaeota archaeon]
MISKENVIEALKQVFDPEIPVNVWDLGLIYDIQIREKDTVFLKMTMTSPACPFAGAIFANVEAKVKEITGAKKVEIEPTFDPPWNPETRMTPEGKAQMEMIR